MWPSPSKASSGRSPVFRKQLMKHYGIKADPETQQIKCMITGLQVPAASIRAGHLFPLRLDVSD